MTLPSKLNRKTPDSLTYKLVSAEQVRQHEREAARLSNCTMYELMQRAGKGAFSQLLKAYPKARNILVLVGWGNNAGDGYIVASLAKQYGLKVVVACADIEHVVSGDALQAQQGWLKIDGELTRAENIDFGCFDVVVDALLGNGLRGEIRPLIHAIIRRLNQSSLPVLSIDLPSGLNADTGQPMPIAVKAEHTVTFVAIKPGLVTGIGLTHCGSLTLDDLAIAPAFYPLTSPLAELCAWHLLPPLLPRQAHANKGKFGRLLCIGGNSGMGGAIRMTAEAGLRSGIGLVKVLCHERSQQQVTNGRPEIMLCEQGLGPLKSALDWCSSIAIGPGLGNDPWALSQFKQVLYYIKNKPKPLVIDADGLNLLAELKGKEADIYFDNCIITPHPGEAARLLDTSIEKIEQNRYLACQTLADKYGTVTVLKGAGSIVCIPNTLAKSFDTDARYLPKVCAEGNPGMATAGMGDVLTGVISGMLGQGMNVHQGAYYGVCLHAAAGDRVASQYGQRGMIASDLFESLRALVNYK